MSTLFQENLGSAGARFVASGTLAGTRRESIPLSRTHSQQYGTTRGHCSRFPSKLICGFFSFPPTATTMEIVFDYFRRNSLSIWIVTRISSCRSMSSSITWLNTPSRPTNRRPTAYEVDWQPPIADGTLYANQHRGFKADFSLL